jgi:YihY family inner membrane protein
VQIIIERPDIEVVVPRHWRPTIRYLSQTEVHVYALAIGASVLLSVFPFLIVVLTLIRDVLHSREAEDALKLALNDYFPNDMGTFIISQLTKAAHRRYELTSILLLLFTANGIFEPLEVALNRAWGVPKNRSYLRNQILSFFMIILCGGLALGSVLLTALDTTYVTTRLGMKETWLPLALFKLAAVPVTILSLLLIYWLLPNRRVPIRRVFPVAVLVGVALELWKYVFLFAWPWLSRKLANEYPQFQYSVAIVIFSMLTALLVLAGAEWSARKPPEDVEVSVVRSEESGGVPVDLRHGA